MEMVSAVKMRKAVLAVLASRDYANTAWNLVLGLAQRVNPEDHQLLARRERIKKIGVILISANRGLCGGFNSQILAKALQYADQQKTKKSDLALEWFALGKKGADFLARNGHLVVAEFPKPDLVTGMNEISALARLVIKDYIEGNYDKVVLAYTDFYSAMVQKPKIRQLLPFELTPDTELGSVGAVNPVSSDSFENFEYLFEPNKAEILNQFLPRLLEIQLYQALLESLASEHSSRMLAMKNATQAAGDMIDELTLVFNQARQANITKEIAEITGSKAALE